MTYNTTKLSRQIGRPENNTHLQDTFDLLDRGEREIILSEKYNDLVLIFGNTGSGKSTFTQWITGNDKELKAREVTEGTGEYIIEDVKNKISKSTVKSKTIFPELVVDTTTNIAYYDCPGFSDTRSTSHDISTTFFIKKVLDHANSVKMIFVVNHNSVRIGLDRGDFMELLRHINDLIKDIKKFRHSIAIVATKVDNQYIKKKGQFVLVDDDKVVSGIVDFFLEVRHVLEERSIATDVSIKEKLFYRNAKAFISSLIKKDGTKFSKIGIFRRPEGEGPLNDISILQDEKKDIRKIINENINFTTVFNQDFGYTISDKSKNDINHLKEEINRNIWTRVSEIAGKLDIYYHDLVSDIRNKIKSPLSTKVFYSNQTEAKMFARKLRTGYNNTMNFLKEIEDLKDPIELSKKCNDTLSTLELTFPQNILTDIESKGKYFNFLRVVSNNELGTSSWKDLFKGLPQYISESESNIKNDVNYVKAQIVEKIHSHLNSTVIFLLEHYSKKSKLLDIDKVICVLGQDYDILLNLTEKIREQNTTTTLLRTIFDKTERLNIFLPRKNVVEIAHLGKYFEYLQIISDQKLSIDSFNRFNPFGDAVKYIYESKKWYTFLNDLYHKFSTYVIQKDRRKYNVADIEEFGKSGKEQGIHISEKNFNQFLQKIEQFNIKEKEYIENIKTTESRLDELNHVLNVTINQKIVFSCSKSVVSIRGAYIGVEDILNNFIEYHDGSCNDFGEVFINHVTFSIFAMHSIFIDTDIRNLQATVKIISPRWEIIGNRILELEGRRGKSHVESKQLGSGFLKINWTGHKLQARNGSYPGHKGDDGKPGGAGGPGPTFLGVGSTFVNGANLTIINNGGKGGAGEDGGNGYVGRDGRDAYEYLMDDLSCEPDLCDDGRQISGYNCERVSYSSMQLPFVSIAMRGSFVNIVTNCEYKIFGKSGEEGGDGGDGGKGGVGGHPGQIILFELAKKSGIMRKFNKGQDGECGKGGIGGYSGYNGHDIVVYRSKKLFRKQEWILKEIFYHQRSPIGKYGSNCFNIGNIERPEPPKKQEVAKYFDEYKRYSRENMKDLYRRSLLRNFYHKLEGDENVQNAYTVLDLVNDFQNIEEQFHELDKNMNLIPFYESLLDRIIDRAKNLEIVEKSVTRRKELKKVLTYLYTATLGRIYNLKDKSNFELIVDISKYLELLKKDIENLKYSQIMNIKLNSVKRLKEDFRTSIEKKIEEAMILIRDHVTPELKTIGKQIDDQIDLLILETIELGQKAVVEITELHERKQKLRNALELRGMFSSVKIISAMLTFLGPFGAATGTIVGSTTAIAESLMLDDSTYSNGPLQLPASVQTAYHLLGDHIRVYTSKKIADLDKMIEDILSETEKYPKILNGTSKQISDIRKRTKKIGIKEPEKVKQLGNELKLVLKDKVSNLNAQKASLDRKSLSALAVVDKFSKACQVYEVGIDIYNKYRNDDAKLNAIDEAIKQSENNFRKLKHFEEGIYNIITPMLQNMEDDLYKVTNQLSTKSRISLVVTKWKVQRTLNDMKIFMEQLIRGFPDVEDNLPRCIEKLEELMTTLVSVYDHIQDYKEQQNLANFIADVSSPVAIGINITNTELLNAVTQLEVLIRSNVILQQYKVALNAFKQFVFPFSHIYMEDFNLPTRLMSLDNVENLIVKAVAHIEKMKSTIDSYDTSVKTFDKYIHIGEFSSNFVSSEPFFVWKNSHYRPLISRLLSGHEIVLKSDVMRSPSNKEAIKFNSISINFKSHNNSIQQDLIHALKAFHVSATHMGNSYYKYNYQIYVIAGSSQTITYSFEKNNGVQVDRNIVYEKIQRGNLMLSPYALWKVKLINSNANISFDLLRAYENEIDLELVGTGSYLSGEAKDLNLNMDDYYKLEDTFSDLEEMITSELVDDTIGSPSSGRYVRSNSNIGHTDFVYSDTTSASCSRSSFFPINSVCNFFKQSISKLKIVTVDKIMNWFIIPSKRNSDLLINNASSIKSAALSYESMNVDVNNDFLETEYQNKKMEIRLLDNENSFNDIVKYESFDVQGSLLLLNLIFHKKSDITHKRSINNYNADYAQKLAYNAYK